MQKKLLYLFALIFLVCACFIATGIFDVATPPTAAKKDAEAARVAFYKAHYKQVGQPFTVDSVVYKVNHFVYVPEKDTTVLMVDIELTNATNHSRQYTAGFFSVVIDGNKVYYPACTPFSLAEKQQLKLIYHLPKSSTPEMLSDMRISSTTDSTQNSFVRFYKNYRAQG